MKIERHSTKTILRTLLPLVPKACHVWVGPYGQRLFPLYGAGGAIGGTDALFVYMLWNDRIPDFLSNRNFSFPNTDDFVREEDGTCLARFVVQPYGSDLALMAAEFKSRMEAFMGEW